MPLWMQRGLANELQSVLAKLRGGFEVQVMVT
jgi:hypothetical protein